MLAPPSALLLWRAALPVEPPGGGSPWPALPGAEQQHLLAPEWESRWGLYLLLEPLALETEGEVTSVSCSTVLAGAGAQGGALQLSALSNTQALPRL